MYLMIVLMFLNVIETNKYIKNENDSILIKYNSVYNIKSLLEFETTTLIQLIEAIIKFKVSFTLHN